MCHRQVGILSPGEVRTVIPTDAEYIGKSTYAEIAFRRPGSIGGAANNPTLGNVRAGRLTRGFDDQGEDVPSNYEIVCTVAAMNADTAVDTNAVTRYVYGMITGTSGIQLVSSFDKKVDFVVTFRNTPLPVIQQKESIP